MDTTIKACVGNYGAYASGYLIDRWITLPVSDHELEEFCHSMVFDHCDELYIADYDGIPFDAPRVFDEYAGLWQLNMLARLMGVTPDYELEAVTDALGCGYDSPDNVLQLCNLIMQADEIPYCAYAYQGRSKEESLGMTEADACGLMEKLVNCGLEYYFDYEAYGREIAGEVFAGDDGYLYDALPDMDHYDWDDVADYIKAAEARDAA